MSNFLRVLLVLLLVSTGGCSKDENSEKSVDMPEAIVVSADGSEVRHTFQIEVADNQDKLYHGLKGRTSMDEDHGLLFDVNVMPRDVDVAFWMQDTLIPLDMVFVDDSGVVFFIYENAQPNDVTPIYPPKRPRAVLEINGGKVAQYGIKVDDVIKTPVLGNN